MIYTGLALFIFACLGAAAMILGMMAFSRVAFPVRKCMKCGNAFIIGGDIITPFEAKARWGVCPECSKDIRAGKQQ